MSWWLHFVGADNPSGTAYLLWSGVLGSDLPIVASVLGALALWYRKHNCEVHRCRRIARHATAGGHTVCRRHHPTGAPTARDVVTAHYANQE